MITIRTKRIVDILGESVSPTQILNSDAKGIDTVKDYILMRLSKKHGISAVKNMVRDIYSKGLSDIISDYIKVKEVIPVSIKGYTEITTKYTFNNLKFEKDIRVSAYMNNLTNADVIKAMSDEELAEVIKCPYLNQSSHCGSIRNCYDCKISYLHRPQERNYA